VLEKLKLGRVSYTNTLPLFYKVKLNFVEFVEGSPSELAKWVSAGIVKGGILSSFFYLKNSDRFLLLPDISISSFGKAGSVLLVSKKTIKDVKSIRPSPESLTSNFLTYVILKKFLNKPVEFKREADAFVVIGDRALTGDFSKSFVYDIGELWFQYTGLPAVFALFLVPKDWALENPELFAKLSLEFINSKRQFFKNLENLNLERKVKNYLKNLNYDFGKEHLRSLELMERFAKELKV